MGKKQSNPEPPKRILERINVTMDQVKAAFTEWERRYREEPERFMSEGATLLKETPGTYGDACGPYFAKILEELSQ